MTMIRIGTGFDVHALVAGRRLVIGGVTIPWERGLEGHSDADVLLHAIGDAILGALALEDDALLARAWRRLESTHGCRPARPGSGGSRARG